MEKNSIQRQTTTPREEGCQQAGGGWRDSGEEQYTKADYDLREEGCQQAGGEMERQWRRTVYKGRLRPLVKRDVSKPEEDGETVEKNSIQRQTTTTGKRDASKPEEVGETVEKNSIQRQTTTPVNRDVSKPEEDGETVEKNSIQRQTTTSVKRDVSKPEEDGETVEKNSIQRQTTTPVKRDVSKLEERWRDSGEEQYTKAYYDPREEGCQQAGGEMERQWRRTVYKGRLRPP